MTRFLNVTIVDMDTVEKSDLASQFLKAYDSNMSKAHVAAKYMQSRFPKSQIQMFAQYFFLKFFRHHVNIMECEESFFKPFSMVVTTIRSISARRRVNARLHDLLQYENEEETSIDAASVIPWIDALAEGYCAQVRTFIPGSSACFDCVLDMLPTEQELPLNFCAKLHTPKALIHHVVTKAMTCGEFTNDAARIQKANKIAAERNLPLLTLQQVRGLVEKIVPSHAASNSIAASICALEVVKHATLLAPFMQDFFSVFFYIRTCQENCV